MRIGLLTEGGYPYVGGEGGVWCDRLVRGLDIHEFDVYAFSTGQAQEDAGWVELPPQVARVRTAPLWTAEEDGVVHGRRARRRFTEHYGDLAAALCTAAQPGTAAEPRTAEADRFANALHGLAELARDEGGLVAALRPSGPCAPWNAPVVRPEPAAPPATPAFPTCWPSPTTWSAPCPLSLDWYEEDGLGAVDLCHAASGGVAALPGLLAHHFFGVPLLVTEYGVRLRTHYLTRPDASPAVRSLLAAFHGLLTAETYRVASFLVPGNAHARRWQERCGADRAKLRTIHPGMDAAPFAHVGEDAGEDRDKPGQRDPHTLVWIGRVEPAKDLVSLLHAFAEVRAAEPGTRLRIVGRPSGPEGEAYLGHCRALAAQLFPDEADGPHAVGQNPVSFEQFGGPVAETIADVHAGGTVTVLSSVVEGFPVGLIEAMFCGRATVSTDVGAVVEVIGGTGLVVPPRNPRALAEACVSLLRDPERRARLGAAARARALELFSVEQNVAAFHGLYLETVARTPVRRPVLGGTGDPLPFAAPAEAHVPGHWTEPTPAPSPPGPWRRRSPSWSPSQSPSRRPSDDRPERTRPRRRARRGRPRQGAAAPPPRTVRTRGGPAGDRGRPGGPRHHRPDRRPLSPPRRLSLAEELYARVPRDADAAGPAATPDAPAGGGDGRRSVTALLLLLLPGALCAASLAALTRTHGQMRLYAAAAGVLAVALALRAVLRRGPLAVPDGPAPGRPPAPGSAGSSPTPCSATACCAPRSPAAPTDCPTAPRTATGR